MYKKANFGSNQDDQATKVQIPPPLSILLSNYPKKINSSLDTCGLVGSICSLNAFLEGWWIFEVLVVLQVSSMVKSAFPRQWAKKIYDLCL